MRGSIAALALLLILPVGPSTAEGASGPADDLMTMVPPEAAIVLAVDSLRDRWREVAASSLLDRLRALPAVRAWKESERGAAFLRSRRDLEKALGLPLDRLRDEILGDAVLLALTLPPDGSRGEPTGLLLARPRDRAALESLLKNLNQAETAQGVLESVKSTPGPDGSTSIQHRSFAPGTKPDEWYAILPDGTFAWSNSESALRGAIGRRPGGGGLGSDPRYLAIRDALPTRALARVYVNPRELARAAERSETPPDPKVMAVLGVVDYAGAAVEWRDGPILHVLETIRLDRLPTSLRPGPTGEAAPLAMTRVPRTALAVACWRWDLAALYDAALASIPEADRPQADALITAARGFLLNKDPRTEILPWLKPGGLAYLDASAPGGPPALVVSLGIAKKKEVADALTNALRTVAALASLDKNRKGGPIRVEDQDRAGVRITTLIGDGRAPAFGATEDRLVLASSADAASIALSARPEAGPPAIERLRADHFPRSSGFLAADLEALHRYASHHQDALARRAAKSRARPVAESERDVRRALEFLEPFGGLFLSWQVEKDGRIVHQAMGLVGRK